MLNKIMLGACGKKEEPGFTFVTSKALDNQLVFDTDWQVKINGSLTSQRARAVTCNEGDTVSILYKGEAVNFSFKGKNIFKRILSPLPKNTNVTDFSVCFSDCTSLTSIPENLFANNTNVTDFSYCFGTCSSLTSIPENLFANNTNVTSFNGCFYYCTSLTSIPENLFANNTNVTDFSGCFYICTSLTSTPENLFANNTNVTDFSVCFSDCTSLTSIPENLFANNTNVTDFDYCFSTCTSLTVTVRISSTVVKAAYGFAEYTKSIGTVYVPRGSTTANTFKTASDVNVNVIEE